MSGHCTASLASRGVIVGRATQYSGSPVSGFIRALIVNCDVIRVLSYLPANASSTVIGILLQYLRKFSKGRHSTCTQGHAQGAQRACPSKTENVIMKKGK